MIRILNHRINMEHLGVNQFYQRSFPRGRGGGGGILPLFKQDAFFFKDLCFNYLKSLLNLLQY